MYASVEFAAAHFHVHVEEWKDRDEIVLRHKKKKLRSLCEEKMKATMMWVTQIGACSVELATSIDGKGVQCEVEKVGQWAYIHAIFFKIGECEWANVGLVSAMIGLYPSKDGEDIVKPLPACSR